MMNLPYLLNKTKIILKRFKKENDVEFNKNKINIIERTKKVSLRETFNIELENCPFCNGKAIETTEIGYHENPQTFIRCISCGCRTESIEFTIGKVSEDDGFEGLMKKWNTRIIRKNLDEMIEENKLLRELIAKSDLPCIYCSLSKDEMFGCKMGNNCCRKEDLL